MKKKLNRRIIKKLKAIEIKREPFKKLETKEKEKPKEEAKEKKEDSEFHEKILEESTEFSIPIIKSREELNQDERIDNLEEFASNLPSTTQKIQVNPYSNQTNYGPAGNGGGNYDSEKRYDNSDKYDNDLNFTQNTPDSLRTNAANPFRTKPFSADEDRGSGNRLEESARITQQYRNEREKSARNSSPF